MAEQREGTANDSGKELLEEVKDLKLEIIKLRDFMRDEFPSFMLDELESR